MARWQDQFDEDALRDLPQEIDLDDDEDDDGDTLIECPACGALIHEDAPRCPRCGTWIEPESAAWRRSHGWFWPAIVALLILVILVVWHGLRF